VLALQVRLLCGQGTGVHGVGVIFHRIVV
jgi:hypothetical protein